MAAGDQEQILTDNRYDDEDDIDWGEDTSEEARKQRMLELTSAACNLAVSADLEKTPQERADLFFQFVKVSCSCVQDGVSVSLTTVSSSTPNTSSLSNQSLSR